MGVHQLSFISFVHHSIPEMLLTPSKNYIEAVRVLKYVELVTESYGLN